MGVTDDGIFLFLKEGQVTLTLTIVDTPGFGGNLDNTNCWVPITDFIEDKYAEYLQEETKIQRNAHIVDNRYTRGMS